MMIRVLRLLSSLHVSSGPSHQSGVVVVRGRRRPLKRRVQPSRAHEAAFPIPFSTHIARLLSARETSIFRSPPGRGFYSSSAGKAPALLHARVDSHGLFGPSLQALQWFCSSEPNPNLFHCFYPVCCRGIVVAVLFYRAQDRHRQQAPPGTTNADSSSPFFSLSLSFCCSALFARSLVLFYFVVEEVKKAIYPTE
jgi:hypothetical protein